jgi:hypothetical protein
MASAELVVNALKDLSSKPELNRYDASLCADIQKRMDSSLKEKNLSVSEKTIFVRLLPKYFIFFIFLSLKQNLLI